MCKVIVGVLTNEIDELPRGQNEIIVTWGQLEAGHRLPLYCPLNYFEYEVVSLLNTQRGVLQPNDNFWRILLECARRSKGKVTDHEKNDLVPAQADLYTSENFLENYSCHQLGDKFNDFCVGISRSRHSLKGPLLLPDLDPPKLFVVPLRIMGPRIYGWEDLGGVLPQLPDRGKAVDGSGPSSVSAGVVTHALDVDLSSLFDDNMDEVVIVDYIDDPFFEDVEIFLLHESFPYRGDGAASRSELKIPQASNIADKGSLSDVGAPGGVVTGTGVPSSFGGGFPSSSVIPSSHSFTIFGGVSSAASMLCSEEVVNLNEDEQDRVLSSLDKLTQHRLVTMNNNLRNSMLVES
ncbi:uncharacterized protein LOC113287609 [Papaver somniferum]|uniref:uncharacterized protein LOC113287609 n=1 Tax=Papaver somniferum TaxID=3469 RepID=UPI000E6F9CFD|nr:uncharacterized protein LOC113287609 [Papaver somniferum]